MPSHHLISLSVEPTAASAYAPSGDTVFGATATFDRAPTIEDNFAAQWASSDPSIATIDPTSGAVPYVLLSEKSP